jgi:hypothetical protein
MPHKASLPISWLTAQLILILSVAANELPPPHCQLSECRLPAIPKQTDLPLDNALATLGLYLKGNFVLFGIELRLDGPTEPLVTLQGTDGDTLATAVDRVVTQVPGYSWLQVAPHLINVYPSDASQDESDLLNLKIEPRVLKATPGDLLSEPAVFLPDLAKALLQGTNGQCRTNNPGFRSKGPELTITAQGTLRSFLNAVVEAETKVLPGPQDTNWTPVGWLYIHRIDLPTAQAHQWRANWSVREWPPEDT